MPDPRHWRLYSTCRLLWCPLVSQRFSTTAGTSQLAKQALTNVLRTLDRNLRKRQRFLSSLCYEHSGKTMPITRSQLLASAEALCNDIAAKAPVESILAHFSTTHAISATEHGLQQLAPFLGRTFTGRTGPLSVEGYFKLLQKYLTYENMSFGEI